MQMLSPQVPTLVSYLGKQSLTEALLGALVDVSQASPSSLVSFLPALRIVGQQFPAFLAHVAKIHGAVGIISEVNTHTHMHSLCVLLLHHSGHMQQHTDNAEAFWPHTTCPPHQLRQNKIPVKET